MPTSACASASLSGRRPSPTPGHLQHPVDARALAGQKKYAEAERLLRQGYEGMKAREKSIPPQRRRRVPEALDRLIELYTVTNKPDEVKRWQAERAKYPYDAKTQPTEPKPEKK